MCHSSTCQILDTQSPFGGIESPVCRSRKLSEIRHSALFTVFMIKLTRVPNLFTPSRNCPSQHLHLDKHSRRLPASSDSVLIKWFHTNPSTFCLLLTLLAQMAETKTRHQVRAGTFSTCSSLS